MNSNNIKIIFWGFIMLFFCGILILTFIVKNDIADYVSIQNNPAFTDATVNAIYKDNYGKYPTYKVELKYFLEDDSTFLLSRYRRSVNANDFIVGSKVKIIYEKNNPKNFFIEDRKPIKGAITGILILFILIPILLLFRRNIFKYYG
ncbi:MAG: hypothetical protein WBM13_05720 [Bacteroidia bacterium]